jgi:hypothetical protein
MDDIGFWVDIVAISSFGYPVSGIIPTDIYMIGCDPSDDIFICQDAIIADSTTNTDGRTTISAKPLRIGGCGEGLAVVVEGQVILENCSTWKCAPISIRSADIDASGEVNLVDFSLFATIFTGSVYDRCCDFNFDGVVSLPDFSLFAFHYGSYEHRCI